jgi:hypothetical protein
MCEVNIYSFEIGKSNMGAEAIGCEIMYTGDILPLILYGAPVWERFLDNTCFIVKLIRIQTLINIRVAKVYCAVSTEVLSVIMGSNPINLIIEESANY